jgi:exosortase B
VVNTQTFGSGMPPKLSAWIPIAVGLLLVFVPTFVDLFNGIWTTDRNAHGPIVLGISLWFLGFRLKQLLATKQIFYKPAPVAGWFLLGFGLAFYVLGRSQGVLSLEVGSLIPIIAGCVVMFFGVRSLAKLWFSFFFMLFFIPLPASLVDAMTQPLKIAVSVATEQLLYWFGYPIARSGVILYIGQYQLLVADACAGLHSLFTLEALGLLYMNLVGHPSVSRNAMLAALIVPISFTSNVLRVITLSLITYYMGDAAGQGFLHEFAGILLFLSALLLIIGVDTLLGYLLDWRGDGARPVVPAKIAASSGPGFYSALGIQLRPALIVGAVMLAAIAATRELTPEQSFQTSIPDFASIVPKQFGDWKEVPSPYVQIDLATGDDLSTEQPYDAVLMRTYGNNKGEQVMLALAYGRQQRQDVKIHRPEVCYEAQGYAVMGGAAVDFQLAQGEAAIQGMQMLAKNRQRVEAVSYWIRIGDIFPRSASQSRWYIFREGMSGKVPDGMLVRASSVQTGEDGTDRAYQMQHQFLGDLVNALPPESKRLLVAQN